MFNAKEREDLMKLVNMLFIDECLYLKPFNLAIESFDVDGASMRFTMSDLLIGSKKNPQLHGGAVATILDTVGTLPVFIRMINAIKGESIFDRVQKMEEDQSRLGTIDLRIDYLRPGRGRYFIAKSLVLRTGSIIAVTRMELENDEKKLIAVGTGTYVVG